MQQQRCSCRGGGDGGVGRGASDAVRILTSGCTMRRDTQVRGHTRSAARRFWEAQVRGNGDRCDAAVRQRIGWRRPGTPWQRGRGQRRPKGAQSPLRARNHAQMHTHTNARTHAHTHQHSCTRARTRHTRHGTQAGAPVPPLATHGEDGRCQLELPPPSTGNGRRGT